MAPPGEDRALWEGSGFGGVEKVLELRVRVGYEGLDDHEEDDEEEDEPYVPVPCGAHEISDELTGDEDAEICIAGRAVIVLEAIFQLRPDSRRADGP